MADPNTERSAGRALPLLVGGSLLVALAVVAAPYAMLTIGTPVPQEVWSAHSLAVGGALATLGWVRDILKD